MSFFKKIFGKKDKSTLSYNDFWNWFQKNEKAFFKIVKSEKNIENGFFNQLSQKLGEIKDGYWYLTGMYDDNTVELVLTADGAIENIVFVEELVAHAPQIDGWKFTALKPPLDIDNVAINMNNYTFDANNLFFYSNDNPNYADEIDITIIHSDLKESNQKDIINGSYIFLDNYLGELNLINIIDNIEFVSRKDTKKELVPISKLKDFLIWRQKEFIEKYADTQYDSENNNYSILTAEYENGEPLIAVINTALLEWDRQMSHPWVAVFTIKYDGSKTNGMPSEKERVIFEEIEEELLALLIDSEGFLNMGRQTAGNERDIYFVCKDFRKPSKVFYEVKQKYKEKYNIKYEIYKDKYWKSFERFHH